MPESGIDDAQLRDELLDLIAKEGLVGRDRLTEDATFESLGLASIDIVMLLMAIEEKYNVYLPIDAELSGIRTLPELLDLLVAKIRSAPAADADARAKAYGSGPSPDADKPA
jgi:acyl carrier protein